LEFHQRGRRTGGNPSQSRPGKYVIERQNGAWIRLSREELREVRNELLRRISAPAPSRAEEIKDSSGEQNDAFHTFLRKYRELSKLNQETYERVRGYAEIVARLRDKK